MRATAARLIRHGDPLRVEETELPGAGKGEAVVEMVYAGVNPVDRYCALGLVASDAPVPRTLGIEGVCRLEGKSFVVRGRGLGTARDGTWATTAVVPAAALVEVPQGVELEHAAVMGVAGVTAWRVVKGLGRVTASDRVLVTGASGGVGSIAVSVAKAAGATVWAQTGSDDKAKWVSRLGADHAVVSGPETLAASLRELAPTVVIDALGGGFFEAAVEALAPKGRIVIYGTSAGQEANVPLQQLYRKGVTVRGFGGLMESEESMESGLRESLAALAGGDVAVHTTVLPLTEVNDAFKRIEERGVFGKLVLDLSA